MAGCWGLASDLGRFVGTNLRSRTALTAEDFFLGKQSALYRQRQVKPRWASDPLRLTLILLARCFAWRGALTIVRPATLVPGSEVPTNEGCYKLIRILVPEGSLLTPAHPHRSVRA